MDRSSPDLGFYSSSDSHDSESDQDYDDADDDHAHAELAAEFQHHLQHHLRHYLGFDFAAVAANAHLHPDHEDEYMNHILGDSDDLDDDSYLDDIEGLEDLEDLEHLVDSEEGDHSDHSDQSDESIAIRSSSEALSEDSLFVDQRSSSPNRLPPIAQLVPEVGGPNFGSRRAGAIGSINNAGRGFGFASGPLRENGRENHRLQPGQEANRESSFGLESLHSDDLALLDELIEMEVVPRPPRRPRTMAAPPRSMTPAANAVVIDLTGDDEEIEQPRANPNPNPRRQTLNHRTPSLTRSDGSLLGNPGAADIIDLTMDDPVAAPPPRRLNPPRAQARFNAPRPPPAHVLVVEDDEDDLPAGASIGESLGQMIHRMQNRLQPAVFGLFGIRDIAMLGRGSANNPLGANGPNLNYGLHRGGQERATPKPAHVPPKPAREGFTRATGETSEDVAVCPGCEEELKYDPDETKASMPPLKRARTKRDNEEHYFWAVKDCGHVYCKNCYEARSKAKSARESHFRLTTGPNNKMKTLCNVPDCESEVTNKTAWVGLFL
ncbi:hypothetical protein B0T21DRAFT_180525 [Apiosordaria backusii]|uniref:Cell cycle control protein n=1 Tax=Apiosordaria backusii TaxID=314023 RepID=A0AA40BLR3_9PEZI|nr:hypothetical protein B0T21DRAFT_180525 [Apiosordaria backusii]